MTPFILLVIGLFLILAEFYLPGAVLGILGGFSILGAIVIFSSEGDSLIEILLFIALCSGLVAILVRFAIWRILKAKPENSIYSDDSQVGFQASSYDVNAIGKKGIVVSDLKPGGYISIEGGEPVPAISLMGYISKGEYIEVVSGQEQSLMVKSVKKG